jgi:hypothetical protein
MQRSHSIRIHAVRRAISFAKQKLNHFQLTVFGSKVQSVLLRRRIPKRVSLQKGFHYRKIAASGDETFEWSIARIGGLWVCATAQ